MVSARTRSKVRAFSSLLAVAFFAAFNMALMSRFSGSSASPCSQCAAHSPSRAKPYDALAARNHPLTFVGSSATHAFASSNALPSFPKSSAACALFPCTTARSFESSNVSRSASVYCCTALRTYSLFCLYLSASLPFLLYSSARSSGVESSYFRLCNAAKSAQLSSLIQSSDPSQNRAGKSSSSCSLVGVFGLDELSSALITPTEIDDALFRPSRRRSRRPTRSRR